MDEKQLAKAAGISPLAAKIALSQTRWSNWLEERKREVEAKERLASLQMVSGVYVDENKYDDRAVMVEMYEDYLRMAQMDQRSKVSFVWENGEKRGRPIFNMTFDEYLREALQNLDWRIKQDVPMLRSIEERGGIGVSKQEAELTIRLCEKVKETIQNYFKLPETEQLIYI